ncbi:MAG TPA: hypothetical protein VF798_05195, partial [Burkholderiaceae bacterium]
LPILVLAQVALEKTGFGPLELTALTGTITLALCYAIHAAYESVAHLAAKKSAANLIGAKGPVGDAAQG